MFEVAKKQDLMIIEIGPVTGPISAQKSVTLKNYSLRCFEGLLRVSVRDKFNLYDSNWRNYPFGILNRGHSVLIRFTENV